MPIAIIVKSVSANDEVFSKMKGVLGQFYVKLDLVVKIDEKRLIEKRKSDNEFFPAKDIEEETKRKEQEINTKRDT